MVDPLALIAAAVTTETTVWDLETDFLVSVAMLVYRGVIPPGDGQQFLQVDITPGLCVCRLQQGQQEAEPAQGGQAMMWQPIESVWVVRMFCCGMIINLMRFAGTRNPLLNNPEVEVGHFRAVRCATAA